MPSLSVSVEDITIQFSQVLYIPTNHPLTFTIKTSFDAFDYSTSACLRISKWDLLSRSLHSSAKCGNCSLNRWSRFVYIGKNNCLLGVKAVNTVKRVGWDGWISHRSLFYWFPLYSWTTMKQCKKLFLLGNDFSGARVSAMNFMTLWETFVCFINFY